MIQIRKIPRLLDPIHLPFTANVIPATGLAPALDVPERSACPPQRSRGPAPVRSAGHVKKPDLLGMRPVEHLNCLGGGLQ
jgi:hypothetical protein